MSRAGPPGRGGNGGATGSVAGPGHGSAGFALRPDAEPLAWHAMAADAVEHEFETSGYGLAPAEVAARREAHGPNRLASVPPASLPVIVLRQFRSPLILIMLVALVVVLLLREYLDASVIGVALALNAIVGSFQEHRAESTVHALMRMVVPKARVVRRGRELEIDSVELVPGDVVLLGSGSRVPADLRLTATNALQIDESLLTGESEPADKDPQPVAEDASLGDRLSMAYTGCVVSSGRGIGIVVATGQRTQLGAIAGMISGERRPPTPMQQAMAGFARIIGFAVLAAAALAFASGLLLGESAHEMFMLAVAVAVATVPEGLPVAVTVALAIGVSRMARRNAVIRHLPAVEALGSTTVIGSDKTGTLTENRMTVLQVWAGGRYYHLAGSGPDEQLRTADDLSSAVDDSAALHATLLTGVLTNEADAAWSGEELSSTGDPTEVALLVAAMAAGLEPSAVRAAYPLVSDVPFEPARRYSASVRERDGRYALYVKGAPERVARMCSRMLTDGGAVKSGTDGGAESGTGGGAESGTGGGATTVPFDGEAVSTAAAHLAAKGLRVLAFAYRPLAEPELGSVPGPGMRELVFCGLAAMADPPRAGVLDSVAACREAGIRVLMITGDHAATAAAIAEQLTLAGPDEAVVDGSAMRHMSGDELRAAIRERSVFARVEPEQKLRIVTELQQLGEVVAVTGDGVNDAPALKAAQIGVAMGRDGTDVAREAADVVLVDDDFSSIVASVEEGRVTFANIRKVAFFLVSTGLAAVVAILVAMWLGWPLLMVPAQILWMNLVTSGLQDIALAFEPGDKTVLRRPPRRAKEGILTGLLWERTLLSALVMAAGTLWMFDRQLVAGESLQQAQTVALTTMVLFQAIQAGNSRSVQRQLLGMNPFGNLFLALATLASLALHVGALYLPATQYVLRVEPISPADWLMIVVVVASLLVVVELHKFVRGRYPRRADRPRVRSSGDE